MKFRHFIYQVAHTFFTRGSTIFTTIVSGILVARFLGAEGKGVLAILVAPVTLVCAFGEFGIRQATGYLIGKKIYDPEDIQASVLALFLITGMLGFIVVLFSYALLGTFERGIWLNLLFACTVPLILLRRYANGLLLGRQMIAAMNYTEIVDRGVILLGLLGLVVWLQYGVLGAGLASFLGPFASALLVLLIIRLFGSLKPRWVSPIPFILLRKGFLYAISLFVLTLNSKISLLMLGTMLDESQAGIYSVGSAISELLWQIALSVGVVLFSRSLAWSSQQARDRMDDVLLLLRVMLPVSMLSAGLLFAVSYFLVPVLYGEDFVGSVIVLAWLLPGTVPLTLFFFMHFYAAGQGHPHLALKAFVPTALITVVLNLLAIPIYGGVGAAISTTISYTIGATVYYYVFQKQFSCSIRKMFFLNKSDILTLWGMCINARP
jgi:O-antigen/teichoic acid export membrane protein